MLVTKEDQCYNLTKLFLKMYLIQDCLSGDA